MRVMKLGVIGSLAMAAFVATFSTPAFGQDGRLIGGGSGITVFEDRNFRGDAATYNGDMSSLPSKFNNKISSLRVGNGETWQICDQNNYRGQCVNVTGEESDLGRNNWDNKISSLRRVSGNGGGWGGGSAQRPPSWAEGTFYSTNANPPLSLTINSSGYVTVVREGTTYNGRYTRNGFYLNNDNHTVTRSGNSIITYNTNTRERVTFSRNSGGWNPGFPGGGGVTPPSWAQGTYYSRDANPPLTLTINRDGTVIVVREGTTYYGRYTNNGFFLNNDNHTVTRSGNTIRTYNTNSRETVNFRKR